MRRIGVLMQIAADDPEAPIRMAAFLQGLQELGWKDGRNARIDTRWGAGDADRYRTFAVELVALAPDVVLATNTSTVRALQQASRSCSRLAVSGQLARPRDVGGTAGVHGDPTAWLGM
jgi:putative ABC transport system substrate-binding protein